VIGWNGVDDGRNEKQEKQSNSIHSATVRRHPLS
jgi:hypothetical protein